jgi:adenylate cyclase
MGNVSKLSTRFKRRLVTILAADVAGFCRLMGADDESTLSQLLAYRQVLDDIVAAGGGRMFGVAGDSWMAEFASPVEAVRCAVECQRAIEARHGELPEEKRIRYRIGIHMGDVIANSSNLFGDEVNIAARLQQLCRPGHLIVSDEVFRHVLGKVDLRFSALGVQRLKNIPTPISAFTADIIAASGPSAPQHLSTGVDVSKPVPGFLGKPALAVLPFNTLGGGSDSEYLGEGFAEDLVNGLSNLRWFPVISRCSSFIFKNQAIDTASIGRALGARYLVTGSVRPAAKDFRLTVSLIEAANGQNLWSHKSQIGFSKFLDTQDEISASIVSLLDSEVERAEQTQLRTREVKDLDSWELIRRGTWHLYRFTKDDAPLARGFFEEALRRDPASGEARIHLAWWHFWDIWTSQSDPLGLLLAKTYAREASLIDERDARAHFLIGLSQMMMGQPEEARVAFHNAIALNPSLAAAHACLGTSYIFAGQAQEGVAPLLLSLRLNPYDPFRFVFLGELAVAFHMQGEWEKACEFAERALHVRPGYWYANAIRIASLARSGRIGKALENQAPAQFSISKINWLPFLDRKWIDYLIEGLKLAGCTLV